MSDEQFFVQCSCLWIVCNAIALGIVCFMNIEQVLFPTETKIKTKTRIMSELNNKKLIMRWDSQTWLVARFTCFTTTFLFIWLPSRSRTATRRLGRFARRGWSLGRSSWFLVGELPDGQATIWCKNIPEKLNPLSRVHARHRRQTDGFAMPLAKRNVVTFG